jgi:hypothetical protein
MSKQAKPDSIGVINPFALAEVVLRKRINWNRVADPRKLLSATLEHPYEELFDPKFRSPLYAGLELDASSGTLTKSKSPSKSLGIASAALAPHAGATTWSDPGDFFEEGAELTDPVQGALGDCYFIAALSSVAWARPYVIAQRNRATGTGQAQFVDMIELYANGKWSKVEVTENLPLTSPTNTYIYARSSESGEIWPAVYEKAYAKWRTNSSSDKPDYAPLAGGDPVLALQTLTGLAPTYQWTTANSAHDIWQKIRSNCISMKTFNPMVAWTYGTSPSPNVNYTNAHIVANHAYSILGWQFSNNQEYVVLRNPWGTTEATLNVDGGIWSAFDAPYYAGSGFWRPIPMSNNDGVFALRSDTFKSYFAGYGWVKTPESP